MNEILFREINNWSGRNYWLDQFMVFSSEWLGYFLILLLLIPLLLTFFIRNDRISSWARFALLNWSYYREMLVVSLVSAFVSRFIFVNIIRYFYYNPRPFTVLSDANLLISHEATSSFPSGHSTLFFALAAGIYLYNKKLGYIYLALAGLIGFARIFTGVHWPLDVSAGAVLGIGTAYLIKVLRQKLVKLY